MMNEDVLRLADAFPSGVIVISPEGTVFVWNAAAERITTLARETVIGTHRDSLPGGIIRILESSGSEADFIDPDGELRHIQKVVHDLSLGNGSRSTLLVFSDITDVVNQRLDMEKLLMETSESKDLMEEQAAKLAMTLAEVEEKNDIIQGQNRKMVDELKMAARLQKSLLPNIYENVNGVSVSSKYIPSIHIGGDLYDVVDMGQGLSGFIIADVSGHGVAAALVTSMFKMSFHNLAATVASPKILFHMLNQEFNPILQEDYITSFYVLTDSHHRTITYSNAGHPSPLLFRKSTGEVVELDTDGFFLGMFNDGGYEEKTFTNIENGDALLLYTDCILETENSKGEPFGMERLKKTFARALEVTHGQEVIDHIEAEVRVFNSHDSFDDDFTVLLLEFWEQVDNSFSSEQDDLPGDNDGFVEF
jgi:serine phosphatase RsbU (regulator of sigma subunit)